MGIREDALSMATVKVMLDKLTAAQKTLRAGAKDELLEDDRISIRSPLDGSAIGTVAKSSPNHKARVADDAVLMAWMLEHRPNDVEILYEFAASHDQITQTLAEHFPVMVREVPKMRPWAVGELLRQSESDGKPVAPGIEVELPDGVVTVRLKPGAEQAVADLVRNGMVALDGTVAPKEIEGE